MSERAILKSLIIDGEGYTPQDEWTVTIGGINREVTKHLNNALTTKTIPEIDIASGGVVFESIAKANALIENTDFTMTFIYTSGTAVQMTSCSVTSHTTLETDGYMALEISGIVQ